MTAQHDLRACVEGVIKAFEPNTRILLKNEIAPLMQWRDISGSQIAYRFDRLCCQLQIEWIRQSSRFHDLRDILIQQVMGLQINLYPVKAKVATIDKVKSSDFWSNVTVQDIENVRVRLRGIMKYRAPVDGPGPSLPKVIDVTEDKSLIEDNAYKPRLQGLELIEYRNRVQSVLQKLMDQSPALQKIRAGQTITTKALANPFGGIGMVSKSESSLVLASTSHQDRVFRRDRPSWVSILYST